MITLGRYPLWGSYVQWTLGGRDQPAGSKHCGVLQLQEIDKNIANQGEVGKLRSKINNKLSLAFLQHKY